MENKKLNEKVVVEVVEETEEKKGLMDKIKSKLPSGKTVLKGLSYVGTFAGGLIVGAFGSSLLSGNQDDSDEDEDNDDIDEENIDDEE